MANKFYQDTLFEGVDIMSPCRLSREDVMMVTYYFAPAEDIDFVLEPLDTLLKVYPNDKVVLVGDFNAKSTIWC